LLPLVDAGCVEGATNHLVADTGKISDTAATNQNHAVLLEVVTLTGDVRGDLDP
jgi:hypothetical protein